MARSNSPPKLSLPLWRSPPHLPIPRPAPLTIPSGIQIQLAVLPQYTSGHSHKTHRPTDGIGDKCVPRTLTFYYIDGEQRAKNTRILLAVWVRRGKMPHCAKFRQNRLIPCRNIAIFQDGGCPPSWISLERIWTTRDGSCGLYYCAKFGCDRCSK